MLYVYAAAVVTAVAAFYFNVEYDMNIFLLYIFIQV